MKKFRLLSLFSGIGGGPNALKAFTTGNRASRKRQALRLRKSLRSLRRHQRLHPDVPLLSLEIGWHNQQHFQWKGGVSCRSLNYSACSQASADFELGLERSGGFETVAQCEIDPFCRRVLAKHWPNVRRYEDVRELTADVLARDGIGVDAICGGFPCQDISFAGKGAGLAGERSGLWREYARLIRELRPAVVIVENVSALLSRGLGDVLGDLAALGYDAEWDCIRASTSAPRTSETASGLLPTPEASNTKALAMRSGGRSPRNFLLPTPRATDGSKGMRSLAGAQAELDRGRNLDLGMIVRLWPTPDQSLWATPTAHPRTHTPRKVDHGEQLANQVGGSLNPTWVEWLMGFPLGWTACMASATPSSRRSRTASVKPS